jgi:murein DD-endopeptidase MepM/ murein hydrolase activator NlpD
LIDLVDDETLHTMKPGLDKGFSTVSDIRFNEQVDILKSQDNGRFASTTTVFDIMIKQATNAPHDYSYSYPDIIHMENYRVENGTAVFDEKSKDNMTYPANVTRSALSKRFFRPVHRKVLTTSEDDLLDYSPDKWLGMRQSVLEDISGLRMHITVPGRTDAEVGKIIHFKYPKVGDGADKSDPKNQWDPFLSGVWMITAIHHKITPVAHNMILEIAKDSFHTSFQAIERAPNSNIPAGVDPDNPDVQAEQENGVSPSSPGPVNKAGWTHPTGGKGSISSKFGPRKSPGGKGSRNHKGVDIAAAKGTQVFAAKDGTVALTGWQSADHESGGGIRVKIEHAGGYTTFYGHGIEGSIVVKPGDKVKAGQPIMKVNSTGSSTGHHLHFEIWLRGNKIDPLPYIS